MIEDLGAEAAVARLAPQGWAADVLGALRAESRVLVSVDPTGDVAALAYTPAREPFFPALLAHVTTRADARGQGHGSALVERLKRLGLGPLEADALSPEGARLLSRAGFVDTKDGGATPWRFEP